MNQSTATLKVFKPVGAAALVTAQMLFNAKGTLLRETENKLLIRRGDQKATIDACGRVAWEPYVEQSRERPRRRAR